MTGQDELRRRPPTVSAPGANARVQRVGAAGVRAVAVDQEQRRPGVGAGPALQVEQGQQVHKDSRVQRVRHREVWSDARIVLEPKTVLPDRTAGQ